MSNESCVHNSIARGSKISPAAHTKQHGSRERIAAEKGAIPLKLVAKVHDKLSPKDANEEKARSAKV